jgi:hypothetical protein
MSGEEHRQQRRAVTVVPVQIVGDLFHTNGYTVTLNAGGCAIAGARVPEKGQHVSLWLQPPKPYMPVKIQLAVVRWTVQEMCGVEFIRLSAAGRTSLQHYAYDRPQSLPGHIG